MSKIEIAFNLEENLKCKQCKHVFNDPRLLPCGTTKCNDCIMRFLSPVTKSYYCDDCGWVHELGYNKLSEFPKNQMINDQLIKRKHSIGNDKDELMCNNLKFNMNKLNEITMFVNQNFENVIEQLKSNVQQVNDQVEMETDNLLEKIDNDNMFLKSQIKNFEANEFLNRKSHFQIDFKKSIDECKKFHELITPKLNVSNPDMSVVKDAIKNSKKFMSDIERLNNRLKSELTNIKSIEFQPASLTKSQEDENLIGKINLKKFDYKNIENSSIFSFKEFDLNNLLDLKNNKIDPNYFSKYLIDSKMIYYSIDYYVIYNKNGIVVLKVNETQLNVELIANYDCKSVSLSRKKIFILICENLAYGNTKRGFLKDLYFPFFIEDKILYNCDFKTNLINNPLMISSNSDYVYCLTDNDFKPVKVFNHKMVFIKEIGQRLNKNQPFYIPSTLREFEVNDTRLFYLSNNEINIMKLSDGVLEKKVPVSASQFATVDYGLNIAAVEKNSNNCILKMIYKDGELIHQVNVNEIRDANLIANCKDRILLHDLINQQKSETNK